MIIRILFSILLLLPTISAHAELQDIIGILTDEINDEGEWSLDIHANSTPRGAIFDSAYNGEIVNNHGVRFTPSLSYGLRDDLELTMSATAVRDGNMDNNTTSLVSSRARLAWISQGEADDEGNYGYWGASSSLLLAKEKVEFGRTILDVGLIGGYRTHNWHFATNAFLSNGFANGLQSMAPDYSLNTKLARRIVENVWGGVELYSGNGKAMTVDGIARFTTNMLFGTVAIESHDALYQFGVGRGLNGNTDPLTLKCSVSIQL
ncbi:MAG: hypothetical protein NTY60_01185 [Proteobacteria bacterium]|nr:hypothetical protein [Pseudomonadota bacterium]